MKVKIKKLHEGATLPTYATDGSGAFDIYSLYDEAVRHAVGRACSTGIALEVPQGHVMLMFSRSGDMKRDVRLGNCVGVIDSDYRGELIVCLRNSGSVRDVVHIRAGDRIAQGMIIPVERVEFEQVEELSPTTRGEGGFGSTGR